MERAEFIQRFTARLVSRIGPTDADGDPVEDYAAEVAPTYWDDLDQREEGPEACADADADEWEAA